MSHILINDTRPGKESGNSLPGPVRKSVVFCFLSFSHSRETGLYYLKSRYYDSALCRFINADGLASTGQGFIGTNMFAYCMNNPINLVDKDGKDAIWIQETNSAKGFGHAGLVSQDENGDWWYFFWGPKNEAFTAEHITGTESAPVFIKLNTEGCDMTTTEGVVSAINQSFNEGDTRNRASKITSSCYFVGDYTRTTEKARSIANSAAEYKLLTYNCVQNTLDAFMDSDSRFGLATYGDYRDIIPNEVYSKVCLIPSKQSDFPWPLVIYNAVA